MSQIKIIAFKEFKDYFISPIAYIVIALFLIVTGWFFFPLFHLQPGRSAGFFRVVAHGILIFRSRHHHAVVRGRKKCGVL